MIANETVVQILNYLAWAGIVLALWFIGLRKLFWSLVKTVRPASDAAATKTKDANGKVLGIFAKIWNWITFVPVRKEVSQAEGDPFSKAGIGILCTIALAISLKAEYFLLKLSFEIVFGRQGLLRLPIADYAALAVLIGLGFAGMLMQDAKYLLHTEKDQKEEISALTRVGFWLLLSLSFGSGVLGAVRAFVLANQNILTCVLIGAITGAVSYLVAYLFSVALRSLIGPVLQAVANATSYHFPYLWVAVKFILALPVFLLLAITMLAIGLLYLFFCLPGFLLDLRDKLREWAEEAEKARAERKKKKAEEAEARRIRIAELERLEIEQKAEKERARLLADEETQKVRDRIAAERKNRKAGLHIEPVRPPKELEEARTLESDGQTLPER